MLLSVFLSTLFIVQGSVQPHCSLLLLLLLFLLAGGKYEIGSVQLSINLFYAPQSFYDISSVAFV